jgi:hypothetical protein
MATSSWPCETSVARHGHAKPWPCHPAWFRDRSIAVTGPNTFLGKRCNSDLANADIFLPQISQSSMLVPGARPLNLHAQARERACAGLDLPASRSLGLKGRFLSARAKGTGKREGAAPSALKGPFHWRIQMERPLQGRVVVLVIFSPGPWPGLTEIGLSGLKNGRVAWPRLRGNMMYREADMATRSRGHATLRPLVCLGKQSRRAAVSRSQPVYRACLSRRGLRT